MKDNEIKEKIYILRAYLGTEENWLLNDIADYITELEKETEADKIVILKLGELLKVVQGGNKE